MNSKGDVVDERLLIRYMYITFSTVRPLHVGRWRANDRFAIFWGKCFERWQSEMQQSLRRRHDEGPKGTRGNGMGACIRRGFPLCPRCMWYTHTHNTHIIIYVRISFVSNTEHPTPKKRKGEKRKGKHVLHSILSTVRARAYKTGVRARARLRAHRFDAATCSLSETRRRERRYGSIRLYSRAVVVVVVGCVPRSSSARK